MPKDPISLINILGPLNEGDTGDYLFELNDGGAAPEPILVISDLRFTLWDADTGQIINKREKVDVTSNYVAGTGTITLTPEDNIIITPTKTFELHRLRLDITHSGGKKKHHEVIFQVRNMGKIGI